MWWANESGIEYGYLADLARDIAKSFPATEPPRS
jgi:hypothetical protein